MILRIRQSHELAQVQQQLEDEGNIIQIRILLNLPSEEAAALHRRMQERVNEKCGTTPDAFNDIWPDAIHYAVTKMAYGEFSEESWWEWAQGLFVLAHARRLIRGH